ncbi:hypothetical protein PAHAL_5G022200 [Panicum hallii]|uniref:Uncharacterized protein n=1 Tax=Panicum hallii TaxID=206008 RepID=A0A2S3HN61_9POAL|nr:hypothetical protein PAHAL_5G022200 [Panicum hallii]
MEDNLMRRRKRQRHCYEKSIFRQRNAKVQFSEIPEDVLGTILSKLPQKEIVRTSVKWKHIWKVCPKLRFDGSTMKFIDIVNGVLKQYSGKVVEELDVKFEFDATLAEHLDDWVNFALSSRAKNLALDLLPAKFGLHPDRYRFPLELFDGGSIFRLQHLQLSFVSLESPSNFCGFPNLKKLDLHVLHVTRVDLQDMLSNCFNLEWLSIVRCHLDNAELKVVRPLPHLLYSHVAYCDINGIEFSVVNLQTFVYRGRWIPFHLGHALAVKDARVNFIGKMTLEFALNALPNLLPGVQNLILHSSLPLKTPRLQGNCSKFCQLKFFVLVEDLSNLLWLASFLRAAPFIEKLDIHSLSGVFQYLKNLTITGFAGCMGQVELLTHIVENASNLEALTIDRVTHFGIDEEYERRSRSKALEIEETP